MSCGHGKEQAKRRAACGLPVPLCPLAESRKYGLPVMCVCPVRPAYQDKSSPESGICAPPVQKGHKQACRPGKVKVFFLGLSAVAARSIRTALEVAEELLRKKQEKR